MIEMRVVWFDLKIHIVQKGDTFWEISKEYGVDFEELKALNPQISSPDMLMPGMKIKIPHSKKTVKKETVVPKETKKKAVKELPKEEPKQEIKQVTEPPKPEIKEVKELKQKPLPMIKEDDHLDKKEIKTKKPINYTPQTKIKQEKPIEMSKQPIKQMIELPMMEDITSHIPEQPKQEAVMQQPLNEPMPYHSGNPCCQPIHHHYYYYSGAGQMSPDMHIQQEQHMMHQPVMHQPFQQQPHPQHCGCQQVMPFHPCQMRAQMPQPFPLPNYEQLSSNLDHNQVQTTPNFHEQPIYPSFSPQPLNQHIGNPFPLPPGYPAVLGANDQVEPNQTENGDFSISETDGKLLGD